MDNIKVKNNAGTEVIYNNVDTLVLPTTDGTGVVFRKWNGVMEYNLQLTVSNKNIARKFAAPYPTTMISVYVD